jgi:hypothetical protein
VLMCKALGMYIWILNKSSHNSERSALLQFIFKTTKLRLRIHVYDNSTLNMHDLVWSWKLSRVSPG